jgi:hypothetical protein
VDDEIAGVPQGQLELTPEPSGAIGVSGERLTRDEAFDLVRRAVESLTGGDDAVHAADVRRQARELLGRDSESLSERNFARIIRDAHDADVVDLRRRGDDFEVARATGQPAVAEPAARSGSDVSPTAVPGAPPGLPGPRMGLGPRGSGPRGRGGRPGPPPPELLAIGIVPSVPAPSVAVTSIAMPVETSIEAPAERPAAAAPAEPALPATTGAPAEPDSKRAPRGAAPRGRGRKQATKRAASRGAPSNDAPDVEAAAQPAIVESPSAARRSGRSSGKTATKASRARKSTTRGGEE